MKPLKPSKLTLQPLQKSALSLATALLWISGVIWLCLAEGHSTRPLWMKIHGAAAMAFLMVFGTLLLRHVPEGWEQNRQRSSGGFLLGLCGILILTGWGLYYSGNEFVRHWTSLIHAILGVALPLVIFLHVRLSRTLL